MATTAKTADIGLIGLAVMGENLVLNMESHGFTVAVFNRTTSKVDAFVEGRAKGKKIVGTHSVEELVAALKPPRKIMIMVKAGPPVDDVINELVPLLEPGDILIDGGNSHFPDSTRRTRDLKAKGLLFIGTGVSGGEEGALKGPSIMPGGDPDAWPHVKPIFQAIAAKVADGTPCCDWVGPEGAGHYVKMVHNGIEYGDMQLICEAYHLMSALLGLDAPALHDVFDRWNKGPLDSYLIEITRDILGFVDPETKRPMVDLILDAAGQKGTGKWTVISACDLGVPLTLIAEAVFARCLSAQKDERVAASKVLEGPGRPVRTRQENLHRRRRARPLRQQDHLLRPGIRPHGCDGARVEVGDQQGGRGPDVARRLHHPQRVPGQDQGSVRPRPQAGEPVARSLFPRRDRPLPDRLEARGRRRGRVRDPRPRDDLGPGLLRRLPQRTAPRQPACKPSATISGPTPTSGSTGPAASFSTPTGPGAAGRPRRRPTTSESDSATFPKSMSQS